jgi:hypothetical protein
MTFNHDHVVVTKFLSEHVPVLAIFR